MSFHQTGASFLPKRRRSKMRLRYIVLPTLGLATLVFLWNGSNKDTSTVAEAPIVASSTTATAVTPSVQETIATSQTEIMPVHTLLEETTSLKNAFTQTTPPASTATALSVSENNQPELAMSAEISKDLNKIEPAAGVPNRINDIYLPQQKPFFNKKISFKAGELSSSKGISIVEKKIKVTSGDTLMSVLTKKGGMSYDNAYHVVETLGPLYGPQDLRTHHKIKVIFKNYKAQKIFTGLIIEKDQINSVVIKKMPDGRLASGLQEKEVTRHLKAGKGTIQSSLYLAADKADVPDSVILSLIKMYSWSVDFQRDIRKDDKFEVMYEEYTTEDGKVVSGKGNILYATLTLSDDPISLYRYELSKGDVDFFAPDGGSVRKTLMRTPINGARLSSGFGRRKHPVLGYTKMHKGLDFAAPSGTPIYAAGDGVLEKVGRNGSYGNYVRIRHRHGLKTAYAHLKGFKSGIRSGKRVKQGDVIGYVGTTGRSTGAHLHYEVIMSGRQVNPKTVKLPTQGRSLSGKNLDLFHGVMAQLNQDFEGLGLSAQTSVANR
ncbi:MAG: peptidoglycan DD-metalloendopeptidase family protein [Gammaproteobacteria bacterium]|nr:peptidoglycan DD-metalloendopeptidase family protein [Gammaproteobacteria bacterium]